MEYKKYMTKKGFINDNFFVMHFVLITAIQIMVLKFGAGLGKMLFAVAEIILIFRIIWQYKLIIEHTDLRENGVVYFLEFSDIEYIMKRVFLRGQYSASLIVKTKDNKIKSEIALMPENDAIIMCEELKTNPIPVIKGSDGKSHFMLHEMLCRYEDLQGRKMNQATVDMLDRINKRTFFYAVLFRYILLLLLY